MPAPPPQEDNDTEMIKWTIIGLVLFLLAIYAWNRFRPEVNLVLGALVWLHASPIALLADHLPVLARLPVLGPWLFDASRIAIGFLETTRYSAMSGDQLSDILAVGGRTALLYYGIPLLWVAWKGRAFRPDEVYTRLRTLDNTIEEQARIWPIGRLPLHVNPTSAPDTQASRIARAVHDSLKDKPALPGVLLPRRAFSFNPDRWGRAMHPQEWLLANGLCFDRAEFTRLIGGGIVTSESDFEFRKQWARLRLEDMAEIFGEQLRSPWLGPERLRPIHRALFAVMALCYDYEKKKADGLLVDIALVHDKIRAAPGQMDAALVAESELMARIDKIIASGSGQALARLGVNHFWVESAFPTFLISARLKRGILASASFVWLKGEDRLMWYILNSCGNDVAFAECAGAIAHWRAERQVEVPICRPAVFQACRELLEDYLDMRPERIEQRQRTSDRTRSPGDQMRANLNRLLSPPVVETDEDGLHPDDGR